MDKSGNIITRELVRGILNPRKEDSHKGTYGHALLIAGNSGRMGAAVIAARACLRAGAGLVTLNIPFEERAILQTAIPEAMLISRDTETDYSPFNVVAAGPGLGTGKRSVELIRSFLECYGKNILLDADALNIISEHPDLKDLIPDGTVLTPHPKEFDRLFGPASTEDQRMQKAIAVSRDNPWVIVLKGHHTLIAREGRSSINYTGNAGLAKAGTGDMLTGFISALLAQGYQSFEAAQAGVYLHGLAADIALQTQSMETMLATDVIECFGKAFKLTMENS